MSDIDQAFINAYRPPASSVAEPLPQRAAAPVHSGPGDDLRIFAHAPEHRTAGLRHDVPAVETSNGPHFHSYDGADMYGPSAGAPVAEAPQAVAHSPREVQHAGAPGPGSDGRAQRRPLSTFAVTPDTPPSTFRPVYEVDAFRWPAITDYLLTHYRANFDPVLETLVAGARNGQAMTGLAGTRPGAGCSTVTMCLARLLAAAGKSLALVDANFSKGNLASSLGLEFGVGWEEVLLGQLPLSESVVLSLDDNIALVPLDGPLTSTTHALASIQSSVIAGVLRYHYDVVLFDLGAAAEIKQLTQTQCIVDHCRLDLGIIVSDSQHADGTSAQQIAQLATVFGAACLGVIGNWSDTPTPVATAC